ncbi:MAG: hypothetical protein ABH827_00360 [bacterium]
MKKNQKNIPSNTSIRHTIFFMLTLTIIGAQTLQATQQKNNQEPEYIKLQCIDGIVKMPLSIAQTIPDIMQIIETESHKNMSYKNIFIHIPIICDCCQKILTYLSTTLSIKKEQNKEKKEHIVTILKTKLKNETLPTLFKLFLIIRSFYNKDLFVLLCETMLTKLYENPTDKELISTFKNLRPSTQKSILLLSDNSPEIAKLFPKEKNKATMIAPTETKNKSQT